MKFLIIDTYYPAFLRTVYSNNPDLQYKNYKEQSAYLLQQSFGTADFYSKNLIKLGHEASDIIANADILQNAWARENGLKIDHNSLWTKVKNRLNIRSLSRKSMNSHMKILTEQIKKARPDVLYVQDLSLCPPVFILNMKKHARLIVGQCACPLPPLENLKSYDVIVTSLPNYLENFRHMGIHSELIKIAFESDILNQITPHQRIYECTFVGGFSPVHTRRKALLEEAARKIHIEFFGYGADTLSPDSPVLQTHHGEVWGINMYKILCQSKMTINTHENVVAGDYANTMRLYEATGCGAMLITDLKSNLNELFTSGKEVVAYKNVDELCEYVDYYGKHDSEREQIAKEGQKRTLREHTYFNRMRDLVDILRKYM